MNFLLIKRYIFFTQLSFKFAKVQSRGIEYTIYINFIKHIYLF